MIVIKGQGVCGGIAFGKLEIIDNTPHRIHRTHIDDTELELERFEKARKKAEDDLKKLYEKALGEVGEENAMIFEIHRMMLEDADYLKSIRTHITDREINAESAVAMTSDSFSDMFSSMEDSYMQARAADVRDISGRLISILSKTQSGTIRSNEPVIVGAQDLAPSQTVQLDKNKILAFVIEKGSTNSHTAILARTMNIPAIIGAAGICDKKYENSEIIVDGFSGEIFIEPDMQTIISMQEKKQNHEKKKELLKKLRGVSPITKDGKLILLYANIGSLDDMASVYSNDAMGVGLFRSEFIYMESDSYPSEDTQFAIYKSAAEKALGKQVIIRTLDIGADKNVEYFDMPKEENPAMGIRAIRICLTRPGLFKTQLRALYRASAFGRISIMFPMITSHEEIIQIKNICKEVREELKKEKLPFNENTPIGIMIETPAAALISDILAKEVDFFSVGTNDLTQYTMAADRQNPLTEPFCDPKHLSVLRLIKLTADNAHKAGIWCGICGELASDTSLTELLLSLGVDELSVSPGLILPIKQKILETDISVAKDRHLKNMSI